MRMLLVPVGQSLVSERLTVSMEHLVGTQTGVLKTRAVRRDAHDPKWEQKCLRDTVQLCWHLGEAGDINEGTSRGSTTEG
eukprot:6371202-Pyramimonas_sp.AAC.1